MKSIVKNLPVILLVVFGLLAAKEMYLRKKFASTSVNITVTDLKRKWGQPDDEQAPMHRHDNRIFKYDYLFGQYVFESDTNDHKIIRKSMID